MQSLEASACTDVTGFGLLGHAYEMAKASQVTLHIEAAAVPLLPETLSLIAQGMLTRGDVNNREYVNDTIAFDAQVSGTMQSALFDPQTAGGLLISLDPKRTREFTDKIESWIVGEVEVFNGKLLVVV
jgi:selenide,water dikinase